MTEINTKIIEVNNAASELEVNNAALEVIKARKYIEDNNIPSDWGGITTSSLKGISIDEEMTSIFKSLFPNRIKNKWNTKGWVFEINTLDEIGECMNRMKNLTPEKISYILSRFIKTKNSKVDESIFCLNENVTKNPIGKDKKWDFMIKDIIFDLKGTHIPMGFPNREPFLTKVRDGKIENSDLLELANYLYVNQSGYKTKSGRFDIQNRLFLIMVPIDNNDKGDHMLTKYKDKKNLIMDFCNNFVHRPEFLYEDSISHEKAYWRFLFLIEKMNEKGELIYTHIY